MFNAVNTPSCLTTIDFSNAILRPRITNIGFISFAYSDVVSMNVILGNTHPSFIEFMNCANFDYSFNIPTGITTCESMFRYCTSLNKPITIPNGVTNCREMFYGCTNYNSPISLPNSVLYTRGMLRGCYNYSQDLYIPDSVNAYELDILDWDRTSYKATFSIPYALTPHVSNNRIWGLSVQGNDGAMAMFNVSRNCVGAHIVSRVSGSYTAVLLPNNVPAWQ